jgi:catechol 2,3-dioxygenase
MRVAGRRGGTMAITIAGVGHAVLDVETLERSVPFYVGILGLGEVARRDFGDGPIAFLSTGGTHHDLGVHEVGAATMPATGRHLGLHHLALRIGDDLETLRAAQDHLASRGIPIEWALDHRVSQGPYVTDPDGHLLELFVDDDPELWRAEPSLVATSIPLRL